MFFDLGTIMTSLLLLSSILLDRYLDNVKQAGRASLLSVFSLFVCFFIGMGLIGFGVIPLKLVWVQHEWYYGSLLLALGLGIFYGDSYDSQMKHTREGLFGNHFFRCLSVYLSMLLNFALQLTGDGLLLWALDAMFGTQLLYTLSLCCTELFRRPWRMILSTLMGCSIKALIEIKAFQEAIPRLCQHGLQELNCNEFLSHTGAYVMSALVFAALNTHQSWMIVNPVAYFGVFALFFLKATFYSCIYREEQLKGSSHALGLLTGMRTLGELCTHMIHMDYVLNAWLKRPLSTKWQGVSASALLHMVSLAQEVRTYHCYIDESQNTQYKPDPYLSD